jgi:hypothetical protein
MHQSKGVATLALQQEALEGVARSLCFPYPGRCPGEGLTFDPGVKEATMISYIFVELKYSQVLLFLGVMLNLIIFFY